MTIEKQIAAVANSNMSGKEKQALLASLNLLAKKYDADSKNVIIEMNENSYKKWIKFNEE